MRKVSEKVVEKTKYLYASAIYEINKATDTYSECVTGKNILMEPEHDRRASGS